jgi:hypothetical protein
MSTFVDRLETELVRVCEAQIAPRPSWRGRLQRLSRCGRLRMLAVLTAVAAIATPAIAIGVGPIVRDFSGHPVSTNADAPPAEQLALLGILRDPPPGASVDAATLASAILPGIHGIRTNYIRLLPPAPGFPHQLLYTATSGDLGVGDPPVDADPATEVKNLICVEEVEASVVGGDCTPTNVLTSGDWRESAGLDGYGLVPDGVATVILHYPDHPAQTETVTDNTFSWQGYPAPEGPITNGGGQPSPGPTPEIPASITWMNANGGVIATHTNPNAVAADRSK